MSGPKFTPGPWEWRNGNFSCLYGNGEMLLYYTTSDDGVYCENDADAPLIAAAPELYEALAGITAGMNDAEDTYARVSAYEVRKARAALAKALGESTEPEQKK